MKLPSALMPLSKVPQFVTWNYRIVDNKKTKPPYKARGTGLASTTNPNTWAPYEAILDLPRIGFVLLESGFCAFDLDDCINEYGEMSRGAKALLDKAKSYAEITPSKRGFRIIGRSNKAPGSFLIHLDGGGTCEVYYNNARYITITGHKLNDNKLETLDWLIDDLKSSSSSVSVNGHDGTRSGRLMKQVARMMEKGMDLEDIESRLRGKRYADIVKKYMNGNRDRLSEEIKRCADKVKVVSDEGLEEINEKYALLRSGGRLSVMCFDQPSEYEDFSLLPLVAFKQWVAAEPWGHKVNAWLSSPGRRQYTGIVFEPGKDLEGYYNLWKGFAVVPRPGKCGLFLQHIHENICSGDDYLYNWVIGWFAHIVQYPREKIGTSLVLRGKSGVGKTKVGEVMRLVLGEHYRLVADPRYITGRFNSHMSSCLLLHADEAFWAGDHSAAGKLKDLVTGEWHHIEYKGRDPIRVRNYLRLFITGNPEWLVPAAIDDRRFATIDVSDKHQQDNDYFAAIDKEMSMGGVNALLHYLLAFDLSKVNLRAIPPTAALIDQKVSSMESKELWWWGILNKGTLPAGAGTGNRCPTQLLIDSYYDHSQRVGIRRRSAEVEVGRFLSKYVPGLRKTRATMQCRHDDGRSYEDLGSVYNFPPLATCRKNFSRLMRQEIDWPKNEDWITVPVD